jgi:hypothetical protein
MDFAGHAFVTMVTVDKYAEDKLKWRHKQSYHAVCQLIEQHCLLEMVQTLLLDVGRWLHNTIQQVSTMTPRYIVLGYSSCPYFTIIDEQEKNIKILDSLGRWWQALVHPLITLWQRT